MDSLLKVRGAVSPTDAPTPDDHRLLLGLLNQILSRIADYQGAGLLPGRADERSPRGTGAGGRHLGPRREGLCPDREVDSSGHRLRAYSAMTVTRTRFRPRA